MNDYIPVELAEEDIEFFDDETGDMIINHPEKLSVGNYLKVKFEDENGEAPEQIFKVVEIVEDGKYKLEWISTIRANESLTEDFQKATVETGSSVLSMEANEEAKITVTSEPKKAEESGDEMIAPLIQIF